jgi:hypothetical protein
MAGTTGGVVNAPETGGSSGGVIADAGATAGAGATGGAGSAGATGGAGGAGAMDAGAAGAGGSLAINAVPSCSKDGWCWSTPAPQGNPLYAISGSGPSDVWAVGEAGTIVHWDGKFWTQSPSHVQGILRGVWAAGPGDAWAVGDDETVLHWDGQGWSALPMPSPPARFHWRAISGTGSDDIWIVGADTTSSTPDGYAGALLRWDGRIWVVYQAPQDLGAVWGKSSNDLWGLGEAHGMFHFDGQGWSTVSTGDLPQIGTAVWGATSSDLFLGWRDARPGHWNGMTASVDVDQDMDIDGLWGSGTSDVWAVGDSYPDFFPDDGIILHWNGLAWSQLPITGASHLFGVWGSGANDVWAVGESGDIVHWDGHAWSAPIGPAHVNLFSVWASGPSDVWAFGNDRTGLAALRWDGQAWAKTGLLGAAALGASAPYNTAPYTAWGSAPDDVWVGAVDWEAIAGNPGSNTGRAVFLHWDGHQWTVDKTLGPDVASEMYMDEIWGTGPNDVWAVGGTAVHWDGMRWSPVTSLVANDGTDSFSSVWASGPKDVWIGDSTTVHHWDGVSWTQPISDHGQGGFLVGGSGPSDVWAVTDAGDGMSATAWRWDGSAWKSFAAPGVTGPNRVLAISPTNAWLLGEEVISHWDGTAWTVSDAGTTFFRPDLAWDGKEVWTISMRGLLRHP